MASKKLTSKQVFEQRNSVDKRALKKTVSNKKNKVNQYHTLSIINLLIDEMMLCLKNNNPINIGNFGCFEIKKLKPQKYSNYFTKVISIKDNNYLLTFTMDHNLKKMIISNLDKEKLFEGRK